MSSAHCFCRNREGMLAYRNDSGKSNACGDSRKARKSKGFPSVSCGCAWSRQFWRKPLCHARQLKRFRQKQCMRRQPQSNQYLQS